MRTSNQSKKPKQRPQKLTYLEKAVKRFLAETTCKTPEEAVLRGIRTLEDWSLILLTELELQRRVVRQAKDFQRYTS